MISWLWLLLIVPASAIVGALMAAWGLAWTYGEVLDDYELRMVRKDGQR